MMILCLLERGFDDRAWSKTGAHLQNICHHLIVLCDLSERLGIRDHRDHGLRRWFGPAQTPTTTQMPSSLHRQCQHMGLASTCTNRRLAHWLGGSDLRPSSSPSAAASSPSSGMVAPCVPNIQPMCHHLRQKQSHTCAKALVCQGWSLRSKRRTPTVAWCRSVSRVTPQH